MADPPGNDGLPIRAGAAFSFLLFVALAAALSWALLATPSAPGLADQVAGKLAASGVGNPVTAVLLNFRGYDTLLELAVLLIALLGVWSLEGVALDTRPGELVLRHLTNVVLPLLVVVAGYLLWAGAHAPGGAFQAGALLGGAGVLLHLAGEARAGLPRRAPLRWLAVAGVTTFLTVGLALWVIVGRFLELPAQWAGSLILLIETVATLSIGATLAALYLGAEPE